ncbi:hypothetical protein [Mycoplasmopsis columboralis]|uniref:Lipoprotein n=1 Tax=Mycoplasmopsis columboralis TaxID=171282 RepID=A0A449B7F5_9BACT|nr:hypothetical protein [Mycoplasmopsis columboralis]VEU76521.1 Uncharacterised protein [Mycoplasmopsis columboralis]
MKKTIKTLLLGGFLSFSSFSVISCASNKEFQLKEQIASALNNVPYYQIRPIVFIPQENKQVSDYTSEALDCMGFIQGNTFTDSNGVTYHSKIISILQQPLSDYAEVKTQWWIANQPEFINYNITFKLNGFKQIPLNHVHYVRSDQKLSCEECLAKYNGN